MAVPVSSMLASLLRGGHGTRARADIGSAPRPAQPLELYSFESCPFCRVVRETLTELELDYLHRSAPKGGTRSRARARELGGREQFPFLVDPNTGATLYESADIIAYLEKTYGPQATTAHGPVGT